MFWTAWLEHASLGYQWRDLVWLSTRPNERNPLIRQLCNGESYDERVDALRSVSLISRFHDGTGDAAQVKFNHRHHVKEAEHLTRFIWNRVITLLLMGKTTEANSLLEEFDQPPLWNDQLD